MIQIEWTSRAFTALENLPQTIAFDIVERVDLLWKFPQIGAKFDNRLSALKGYRQIVVKRNYRVIYDYDEPENRIYILAVQHCRQTLPAGRDLKRQETDEDQS